MPGLQDFLEGDLSENIRLMNGAGYAPNKLPEWLPQLEGLTEQRKELRETLAGIKGETGPILGAMDASIDACDKLLASSDKEPEALKADDGEATALSRANARLADVAAFILRELTDPDFKPKPEQTRAIKGEQ